MSPRLAKTSGLPPLNFSPQGGFLLRTYLGHEPPIGKKIGVAPYILAPKGGFLLRTYLDKNISEQIVLFLVPRQRQLGPMISHMFVRPVEISESVFAGSWRLIRRRKGSFRILAKKKFLRFGLLGLKLMFR